ncbi:CPBP family intramembrane glutamic endopeptidase [Pseudogracilibacillus auburnensis]|uniref:CPBP family intramembrane glutamic endopeptidase n=1 Tax=Pseudogracilibacillus auburnensis TaxID=1494959 RepID=UPI001A974A87|nr:CPBP family intramembrane glutamic endopeptidase [Pseudogracilibacillus auburnensis]MBO1003074.1 CPBP family intramembrane metalloprotease [Pseudogracilibacillus auburnensis]
MKQAELIKKMSDQELKKQLLFSQSLFFILSIILSLFLFPMFSNWFMYLDVNVKQIIYYGCIPAIIVVLIEIVLHYIIPRRFFDDGGINEKIFKNQSIVSIFVIALVVAISEEFLFRGVIQTTFGYIFASSLFIVIHFRYLTKPVLLTLIILISFLLGYLFELTGNLIVTIIFHFIVDFLLGIFIKYSK